MNLLNKISDFFTKYMAISVVIAAAFSLVIPSAFLWVAPNIPIFLGVAMFGMGMTLKISEFREVFKRPKDVFIGALAQFTIMPLLAFCLAKIFQVPPELAAGIILVGTCPGGTSSNVMTYLAKGDVALSVSMTMTTTILAPILTPILTWLLVGAWLEISLSAMMISICKIVIVPIFLGIVLNTLFGKAIEKFSKLLPLVSIITIILIVGGVVAINAQKLLEVGLMTAAVVMIHNLLGYSLGFIIAKILKMNTAKATAISIEVGMQNSGLATSLAMLHFGAAAAIPGAIFSVWHNISGSITANILSKYNNK